MNKHRYSGRGFMLVTAVWIVLVTSIVVTQLARNLFAHSLLFQRGLTDFESELQFVSGIQQVIRLVLEDAESHEDSPLDNWFGEVAPLPEGIFPAITVSDEDAKLNLNRVPETILSALWETINQQTPLRTGKNTFTAAIAKARTKNFFKSVEELCLLEEVACEDAAAIRPWVTVYGDTERPNLNTIRPAVLSVLFKAMPGDTWAKEEVRKAVLKLREHCSAAGDDSKDKKITCAIRAEEMTPEALTRRLGLKNSVQISVILNTLCVWTGTDSETFRIRMKTSRGREAEAVIGRIWPGRREEIYYWYEY